MGKMARSTNNRNTSAGNNNNNNTTTTTAAAAAATTSSPPDENPYFDPVVTHSVPQSTEAPTTPVRERPPPAVSRPRGFFTTQGGGGSGGHTVNRQQSSIGLRRLRTRPSRSTLNDFQLNGPQNDPQDGQLNGQQKTLKDGRRRSTSEPQRPSWLTSPQAPDAADHLPSVSEATDDTQGQRKTFLNARNRSWFPHFSGRQQNQQQQQSSEATTAQEAEYDSRIVDFLDVVDPEVSTLTSITNLQNSLFVPSLGRFVNRRPTYDLSFAPDRARGSRAQSLENIGEEDLTQEQRERPRPARAFSITSNLEDSHYAVLPHGATLEGWSQEDVDSLNDHVRHMLHSRRSKFKRSMKAFGRYVRRPLGFLVTLYATLITLFGLAWVLFLIGWISIGEKQLYVINVIDYILVALFAIVGDGLAPFRAVDTYHMIYIAYYHHASKKIRKKLLLPDLHDENDLPEEPVLPDLEAGHETASIRSLEANGEFSVLSPQQQAKLVHHQTKYAKSHTFYRPHETETHFAFPHRLFVTITLLLDLHSCLQISLGACTWGIDYHVRPQALTTVILCCSITVNATAGLLIWLGDRKTRKKDVIERMSRQELTEEAIQKVKKQNEKEAEKAAKQSDSEEGAKSPGGAEDDNGGWRKSLNLSRKSRDIPRPKDLIDKVKKSNSMSEKGGVAESSTAETPKRKPIMKGALNSEPPNIPAP